jgi:hypothetical protein
LELYNSNRNGNGCRVKGKSNSCSNNYNLKNSRNISSLVNSNVNNNKSNNHNSVEKYKAFNNNKSITNNNYESYKNHYTLECTFKPHILKKSEAIA